MESEPLRGLRSSARAALLSSGRLSPPPPTPHHHHHQQQEQEETSSGEDNYLSDDDTTDSDSDLEEEGSGTPGGDRHRHSGSVGMPAATTFFGKPPPQQLPTLPVVIEKEQSLNGSRLAMSLCEIPDLSSVASEEGEQGEWCFGCATDPFFRSRSVATSGASNSHHSLENQEDLPTAQTFRFLWEFGQLLEDSLSINVSQPLRLIDRLTLSRPTLDITSSESSPMGSSTFDHQTPTTKSFRGGASQAQAEGWRYPSIEQLPVPNLLVGFQSKWIEVLPSAFPLWETAQLEPYSPPKDVSYYVLLADHPALVDNARFFFAQLSAMYTSCRLGSHTEACDPRRQPSAPPSGFIRVPITGVEKDDLANFLEKARELSSLIIERSRFAAANNGSPNSTVSSASTSSPSSASSSTASPLSSASSSSTVGSSSNLLGSVSSSTPVSLRKTGDIHLSFSATPSPSSASSHSAGVSSSDSQNVGSGEDEKSGKTIPGAGTAHTVIVYAINSFSSKGFAAFARSLAPLQSIDPCATKVQVVVQYIEAESVLYREATSGQLKPLSFSVYSRARRGFLQPQDARPRMLIYEPPVILAHHRQLWWRIESQRLTDSTLHCTYSTYSIDSQQLIVQGVQTDSHGELLDVYTSRTDMWNRDDEEILSSMFSQWLRIVKCSPVFTWGIVVAKSGPLTPNEVEIWSRIFQLSQQELPGLFHVTLVTIHPSDETIFLASDSPSSSASSVFSSSSLPSSLPSSSSSSFLSSSSLTSSSSSFNSVLKTTSAKLPTSEHSHAEANGLSNGQAPNCVLLFPADPREPTVLASALMFIRPEARFAHSSVAYKIDLHAFVSQTGDQPKAQEIVRFVAHEFNALSWLNLSADAPGRLYAMPFHVVLLHRLVKKNSTKTR